MLSALLLDVLDKHLLWLVPCPEDRHVEALYMVITISVLYCTQEELIPPNPYCCNCIYIHIMPFLSHD